MTRKLTLALALVATTVLGVGSASACKRAPNSPLCQVGQADCEPTCITTSDGPGQPYTDGRKDGMVNGRQWIQMRLRQQRIEHARETAAEGRNHTSDMATGGTKMANGITVSPFVPGSTQDQAWQAERHRRGLCGQDRLCLGAK